ncbi:MAG: phosphatidate cytidylyltransferase [Gemmatimonadota bacterium]
MGSNLAKRLAVAAVGVPLCVGVTLAGGLAFAVGLGLLSAVAVLETAAMFRQRGDRFLGGPAAALAALFPIAVLLEGPAAVGWLAAGSLISLTGLATLRIPPAERPFLAAALSFATAFYVGGLLAFGVPLRETMAVGRSEGTLLFFLPVVVTWLVDTAAYTGGRAFGRRPLAPGISPNKTVEGAVSALIAGPLAATAYGSLLLPDVAATLGPLGLALLGLVLAAAAIVGDLVESSLKRECGVKDSSALLPGHGGLLDRMDSLLWAIPVAWLFMAAVT